MIFSKGYGYAKEWRAAEYLSPTEHVIGTGCALALSRKRTQPLGENGFGGMLIKFDRWPGIFCPKSQRPSSSSPLMAIHPFPMALMAERWMRFIHPHLVRWYTQNHNEHFEMTDPRLVSPLIGLDAHTPSNLGVWRPYLDHLQALRLSRRILTRPRQNIH